jgi:hypothetical protein
MAPYDIQPNSQSWLFYVKASFALSLLALTGGVLFLINDAPKNDGYMLSYQSEF